MNVLRGKKKSGKGGVITPFSHSLWLSCTCGMRLQLPHECAYSSLWQRSGNRFIFEFDIEALY
jgi:hypothetical protein